jgi:biopolymer transport protein ExbD
MTTLIPEDELELRRGLNLAPMVDFLFLILAVFAVLAVTQTALYDSEVNLVKMDSYAPPPTMAEAKPGYTILLSINSKGHYKWVTEFNEFMLETVDSVRNELIRQEKLGHLPSDKSKTKVLLHIDKDANWESIARIIFAIKEAGYQISPVYTPD